VSGAGEPRPDTEGQPRPLRTEARYLTVHWLVDGAVAFLALIIIGLILGATWWAFLFLAADVST
jgi:hypothetical protein